MVKTPSRDTANKLVKNKNLILKEWEARVRERVSASSGHQRAALMNSMPLLLDAIARTLVQSTRGKPLTEGAKEIEIAREHGRQRVALGTYTLEQVIHEYEIIKEVLFEVMAREGAPVSAAMRALIVDALLLSLRKSAGEFHRIESSSLNREVSERTEERDQLEREKLVRERFVSTLTHDMKTPLTAARVSAQLLGRRWGEPGVAEKLIGRIIESIDRADQMIQDLLDVNRVQAGEDLALNMSEHDLREIAQSTLEDLRVIHGHRFRLEAPESELGYWNRDALRRILENLCTNAVKYGHPLENIHVTLKPEPESVSITVLNHGEPISPEDQATLFEYHQRSKAAQFGEQRGWGLGLALVRGLTEAHGGRAEVESDPQGGTRFRIHLPRDARKPAGPRMPLGLAPKAHRALRPHEE
jgi:signal transduction histidine kinase